jgi:trans-aconitate methyltransferase
MTKTDPVNIFDENAVSYDKYRPGYPQQMLNDLFHLGKLQNDDSVLEIGCGTGQLTLDLLDRGLNVTALEVGKNLTDLATRKLAEYSNVTFINSSFEEWITNAKFDLVVSAQAFHWIKTDFGIKKSLGYLQDDGSIALIWNLDVSQNTDFWEKTAPVYNKFLPSNPEQKDLQNKVQDVEDHIISLKDLNLVKKEYHWEKIYKQEDYLGLLHTFSPHMSLPENRRKKFFTEIENIIEGQGNQVLRKYKTLMLLMNRKQD